MKALAQLAEGNRISSVTRTTGHKEHTLLDRLCLAATQVSQLEVWADGRYRITRGQLDGLWADTVGNKQKAKDYPETETTGQFWRSTMLDMDSRLRVARGIAKTETAASREVFETLKTRGHPDARPPTMSDGWGGIDDAMIAVYGQVPEYSGPGRPPTRNSRSPAGNICNWSSIEISVDA